MLGIPGFIGFMFDLSFFEIGTFASGTLILLKCDKYCLLIFYHNCCWLTIKGNLGKIELGCMAISQEILFIVFQFSYGIGIAGNIHIGQHLGANQPERAKNLAKAAFLLNGISALFLCAIVFIFSDTIPHIFSHDK